MKNDLNKLILALPNSSSESMKMVINRHSNQKCKQIFNYSLIEDLSQISYNSNFLKKLFINFKTFLSKNHIYDKLRNTHPVEEYKYLKNFHSDICDFDFYLYKNLIEFLKINKNCLLKQHFPPTKKNRFFFKNFRKVLLIRNKKDALNKYIVRIKSLNNEHIYNEYIQNLENEINNWIAGWIKEPNILVIKFEDIIINPKAEFEKIEKFLEIKIKLPPDFKYPRSNSSLNENLHY